ncbi:hypothetical protein [Actinomadura atramentaria]|uniref:hypothetical protein n=1 Tax=Actinomadura atramentaria TaxID=1990 RepID=UPI00036FBA6E|nr:hypothetical protein [Actinomadura atramentaria]
MPRHTRPVRTARKLHQRAGAAAAVAAAQAETVVLADQLAQTRQALRLLQADHAELLAHARAVVAAAGRGDLDPVAILSGLLEERGQLPAPGQSPRSLLAAGWAGA